MSTYNIAAPDTVGCSVLTWNTAYPVLAGGVATAGLPFWCRSAVGTTWDVPNHLRTLSPAALISGFTGASWTGSALTVSNGRWDAVVGYWAGGAPGFHGATSAGQVAYYYKLTPRSLPGRAWFGSTQFFFALGGHGLLRIEKEVAGVFTRVFPVPTPVQPENTPAVHALSETDFLTQGLALTSTLDFNATYHVFYAQQRIDPWGGFVVKAVPGARTNDLAADAARAREAPIASCGLFDDGTPPDPQAVLYIDSLEVTQQQGQISSARVVVPLINSQVHDGAGWELVKSGSSDPGYLRLWDGGTHNNDAVTLRRGRVIQIRGGYAGNQTNLFTGTIVDFDDASSGRAVVQCAGIEQRLNERIDRNYPDPISYMGANYRALTAVGEPVYGINAFDAWPLELAIAECAQRGGLDASIMWQQRTVPTTTNLWTPVVDQSGAPVRKFRARALNGQFLKIDRPIHYGNAGLAYDATLPPDDEYGFKPEATQLLWQRMRGLADRYGYDLYGDADGALTLNARYNPTSAIVASATGGYVRQTQPAAYGGQYVNTTGTTPYTVTGIKAARLDVVFGLGPDNTVPDVVTPVQRQWSVRVLKGGAPVYGPVTVTLPSTASKDEEVWYYDTRHSPTTLNAAVVTVFSGDYATYDLELTPIRSGAGEHRLNAVFAFHADPDKPVLPSPLSTAIAAPRVSTRSAQTDQRNHVVVVGRRKAAVTDSEKSTQNPENPEGEFVVDSAVDVNSVVNPAAPNYVGYPREALIYDKGISDQDYAAWVARTFIYRQAQPLPTVSLDHTLLPTLRLREPVYVHEVRFGSVEPDRPFYVTGFTHRWNESGVRTEVTAVGQPEYPSYEPRADIDIDALYDGNPVANVEVRYTSLTGHTKTNLGPPTSVVRLHNNALAVNNAGGDLLEYVCPVNTSNPALPTVALPAGAPWPPVPGTVRFRTKGALSAPTEQRTAKPKDGDKRALQPGDSTTVTLPQLNVGGVLSVEIQKYAYNAKSKTFEKDGGLVAIGVDPTEEFFYAPDYFNGAVRVFRKETTSTNRSAVSIEVRVLYQSVDAAEYNWLTNNPYHHFFNVRYNALPNGTTPCLEFPWQEADSTGKHVFPASATQVTVQYRRHIPQAGDYPNGESPFYDPYTSEIGHYVQVGFDALISGQYRISVRVAGSDAQANRIVAWLTEPTADPDDAEAHWQFFNAGRNLTLTWDGVDQVGGHNAFQSELIGSVLQGAFTGEGPEVVGKGCYAWNRERDEAQYGPLALISNEVDGNGKPIFGVGTFGVWYIQIEARNDYTAARASDARPAIRTVRTTSLNPAYNASSSAYIYTHLPAPTQLTVTPAYFSGTYDENALTQTGTWVDGTPPAGTIDNTQPTRLTFGLKPRPGVLWTGKQGQVTARVTRHAHLRVHLYDQFVKWTGATYERTNIPERQVVSRRLTNDDHTWTFVDEGWRTATAIAATPWIFQPKQCRKQFNGRSQEEPLAFGDYLQLEEVPSWNASREIAGARARFQLAMMNYLFYLSAFCEDRSGRRMWGINPAFVDKAKIITNNPAKYWPTYQLEHGDPPYIFQRRSMFTREWAPAAWTGGMSGIGYGTDPLVTQLCNGISASQFGTNLAGMQADKFTGEADQLPSAGFGAWTWQAAPLWIPSLKRDFHGYRRMPPMPGWADGSDENIFTKVSEQGIKGDEAATDVWCSFAADMTSGGSALKPGFKAGYGGPPAPNEVDLLHQDDMVGYEALRGSWSRGPRPGLAPIYTAPVGPYAINQFHYWSLHQVSNQTESNQMTPFWVAAIDDWFALNFRTEYVWESPAWFPVRNFGMERLDGFNEWLMRINRTTSAVLWDHGAWIGWKEDGAGTTLKYRYHRDEGATAVAGSGYAAPGKYASSGTEANPTARVFDGIWQPIGLGPRLSESRDCHFRLVLVPERRG